VPTMYSEVIDDVLLPGETLQPYDSFHKPPPTEKTAEAQQPQAQAEAGHVCSQEEISETRAKLYNLGLRDGKSGAAADDCVQDAFLRALEAGDKGEPITCLCRFAAFQFSRVKVDEGRRRGTRQRATQRYRASLGQRGDEVTLATGMTAQRQTPGPSLSLLAWQQQERSAEAQLRAEVSDWQLGRAMQAFMDAVAMAQVMSGRMYTKEVIEEVMQGKTGAVDRRRSQELQALRADLTRLLQHHPDFETIKAYARSL
jgi:DNA-directed RNA polymerase specialized sigma24 family protein